jgi:glycosyltransferase involved in cell wall biosynthesis
VYEGKTIAAVVPAFKEEAHIARVVTTMPDTVDIIVVVDDHSPDETYQRAVETADPRLTVIRHEVNQGVGGAIMTAHAKALELGADIDVVFAGDGQMDPAYLPDLLDPIVHDGYGFTKANRFYSSKSFHGMPFYRIIGNVILSFLNKLASGYWNLFDPQNGYTAITQDTLRRLPLERIASRYSFENDLLIHLNILRVPAIDVPIPAVYGEEVSSIKLKRVIPELLRLLFGGFWKRFFYKYVLWSFSPIALFLFMGLFLMLLGTVAGIFVIVNTLGPPEASAGSVLLSVAPLLVGVQMLLYALMLDIQESPDSPMTIDYRRMADAAAQASQDAAAGRGPQAISPARSLQQPVAPLPPQPTTPLPITPSAPPQMSVDGGAAPPGERTLEG